MLSFLGLAAQFAALVEVDGALEGMVRLARVQSDLVALSHVGVRGPCGPVFFRNASRSGSDVRQQIQFINQLFELAA